MARTARVALGRRLSLQDYSGTAGQQSGLALQGTNFSTRDADNDNCLCKCAQMLSGGERGRGGPGWGPRAAPPAPSPAPRSRPAPSRRLVVRRLRPLQPERHLLPGPAQHPQAQRHPLAPLPGPQLLAEGHPHADTARGLLARWRTPVPAPTEPSRPAAGAAGELFPQLLFLTLSFLSSPGSPCGAAAVPGGSRSPC